MRIAKTTHSFCGRAQFSWYDDHFHPIAFNAESDSPAEWHIQYPLKNDLGDRGVGNFVSYWLKSSQNRFTNIRWYIEICQQLSHVVFTSGAVTLASGFAAVLGAIGTIAIAALASPLGSLTPKVTDIPPDFLGIHDCPVVIGENPAIEVEYKCDADHRRAFFEYDAPVEFNCWECGPPEVPFKLIDGGCPYPPDGVIFVLDELVPTQPASLEDEPDFTPYSFQHELSFTTKPYDEDCPSP
ncbi:MAG: hypothetical protein SGI77_06530 [Pirellulaceae bacterium]|nr:hypothetical protein [Pirellulaceae bacterium]